MSDFTLTTLDEAQVTVISELGDNPNVDNNLTASQLRAKFDQAGKNIRTFLNNTLITELQTVLRTLLDAAADGAVTTAKLAANAVTHAKLASNAVEAGNIKNGEVTDGKLAANSVNDSNIKSGAVSGNYTATIGTTWVAQGPPFVQQFSASGIVEEDDDHPITWACTSAEADVLAAYALLSFEVETNLITASCDSTLSVNVPVKATQDGTDYTFTVNGLSATGAPFTQAVTVSGLLATDKPIVDLVPSSTMATADTELEAYASIFKMTASADTLTVYASEKTSTSVSVQLQCVRK